MRTLALVLAVAVAVPPTGGAQAPAAPPVIPVTTAEVAVDFVVRDKKGRIVRDLRPSDVEVLEDGVRQEVALFQLVSTSAVEEAQGAVVAGTSASAPPVASPGRRPRPRPRPTSRGRPCWPSSSTASPPSPGAPPATPPSSG